MRVLIAISAILCGVTAPRCGLAQVSLPARGTVLRFTSQDSVEFLSAGQMYLATGQPGFLIAFHPFVPIADTVKLRSLGGEIWRWLRPQLDSTPTFVVLQASSLRANGPLVQKGEGRNLVLERRPDGKWYFLHENEAAR